jgi:hypothetical protein
MAVLRIKSIVPNRNKTAPLSMIPVGSRQVAGRRARRLRE